jgi:hypothetical protein
LHTYIYTLIPMCEPQVREVCKKHDLLSHAEAIIRIIERKGILNPLFEAPWVVTEIFKMDWLHAADQGIAADYAGTVFYYLQAKFDGTVNERYLALYGELLAFYDDEEVVDRMDTLQPKFVESRQGMKLKCSAAKCRKLIPFLWRLSNEMCDRTIPAEDAIYHASFHLHEVYKALSQDVDNASELLREHGTKFGLQYVALHDHLNPLDDRLFRIKPKLHFFIHLCCDGGRPAALWCYRDEDFGGSVAMAARRRGGLLLPAATSRAVLIRFTIGTPRISIR